MLMGVGHEPTAPCPRKQHRCGHIVRLKSQSGSFSFALYFSTMENMHDRLDWQSTDDLGLDVGDVCNDKSVKDAREPYLTAVPGAFAFIFFYLSRYPRRLGFYSRVDHPENKNVD